MTTSNEIEFTTTILNEHYTPLVINPDTDVVQCTLSKKIVYRQESNTDDSPLSFTTAFSITTLLPDDVKVNVEQGTYVLNSMANALHIHHVTQSIQKDFGNLALSNPDVATAYAIVQRSLNQATKDISNLLEVAANYK